MKLRIIIAKSGPSVFAVTLALILTLTLVACGATDVVASFAKKSFRALTESPAARVEWSESEHAWSLSSIAGDRFSLSADFSRNGADAPDASFSFDAAPFAAAGLDAAKLPAAEGVGYSLADGRFTVSFEIGDAAFASGAKESFAATFGELAKFERGRIGYHDKLDHYGITLGNGNMFEWAKDMGTNDKDIVFILDPAPFIAAGVDPARIEGWAYAKVETKDARGKMIQVDKLLKPFDLAP